MEWWLFLGDLDNGKMVEKIGKSLLGGRREIVRERIRG